VHNLYPLILSFRVLSRYDRGFIYTGGVAIGITLSCDDAFDTSYIYVVDVRSHASTLAVKYSAQFISDA